MRWQTSLWCHLMECSQTNKHGDLEIECDMRLQRREWLIERIGWGLMALFLLFGLLGLLGAGGPLSRATLEAPDGSAHVEYDRLMRVQSPASLNWQVTHSANTVRLGLSRQFLQNLNLAQTTPAPAEITVAGKEAILVFDAAAGPTLLISMQALPLRARLLQSSVTIDGRQIGSLAIRVLP